MFHNYLHTASNIAKINKTKNRNPINCIVHLKKTFSVYIHVPLYIITLEHVTESAMFNIKFGLFNTNTINS